MDTQEPIAVAEGLVKELQGGINGAGLGEFDGGAAHHREDRGTAHVTHLNLSQRQGDRLYPRPRTRRCPP